MEEGNMFFLSCGFHILKALSLLQLVFYAEQDYCLCATFKTFSCGPTPSIYIEGSNKSCRE